jgi:hypothetical protein
MSDTQPPEAAMNMGTLDPAAAGAPQPVPRAGLWHPTQGQMFDPRRKSPLLAAVLSVFPGVGQLYIGYYVRGFVVAAIFLVTVATGGNSSDPVAPVLGMFAAFLWVFNVIDSGRMAALYNHAAAGTDTVELPEDFKLPKMGGSIIGGAVLLVFGAIALSNTAFGYSLDWVEVWWPVFPFALGAYLFARGVMDFMAEREADAPKYEIDDDGLVIDD